MDLEKALYYIEDILLTNMVDRSLSGDWTA